MAGEQQPDSWPPPQSVAIGGFCPAHGLLARGKRATLHIEIARELRHGIREEQVSEQPWIKSYPPGVRWDADLELTAVQDVLTNSAKQWPNQASLDFMGRKITFAELDTLANRAAKGFQGLGVKAGVHVGLFLPNSPHYAIAFFGVLRAGGVVVNYSPLDAEKVLEHKVADSETDILVTLDLAALYPQMSDLLGKTRVRTLVIGDLAEFSGHPQGVRAQLAAGRQLADVVPDARHVAFTGLLANDGEPEIHAIDPKEAIAVLQYTGGTTGAPKGAMLTHANLTAAVSQYLETTRAVPPLVRPGEERVLSALPPFHIYSLTVVL